MNKRHFSFVYAIILYLIQLWSDNLIFAQEIIIAHPKVALDSLSSNELKNIFLGKKTYWPNGERIVVVMQKSGIVHDNFLNEHIDMTAIAFRNYWRKRVFSGVGLPPESFDSDSDIVRYVAAMPGAISYIANNSAYKNVKILSIY